MYLKISNKNYSFRYKIPIDLREYFHGRHELIVSLKTKDAKLAKTKAMRLGADTKDFIERIRWMVEMELNNIDELVSRWLADKLQRDFHARLKKSSLDGLQYDELPSQKQEDYTRVILDNIHHDMRHLKLRNVAGIANDLLHGNLNVEEEAHKELMFKLLQAHVSLFEELNQRNQGKFNFMLMNSNNRIKSDEKRITYADAIEKYLLHLKSQTSEKEYPRKSNFLQTEFLTIFGSDVPLADYYDDVIEQLDEMALLPKGSAYMIRNEGKTKDELIALGETVTLETYKKYVMWTKAFFLWAYETRKLTETNIAKSFKKLNSKNASMRRSLLEDGEVKELLSLAKRDDKDLYVMLKILAYTGMRHSEFFKMKIIDNGFSLMDENIELKTTSSYRIIPRHEALKDIDDSVIYRLQTTYTSQMLSRSGMLLLRKITDDPTKVVYSLRHNMIDKLINLGVDIMVVNDIVGHQRGQSMSANRYFKGFNIEVLSRAINLISYEV